MRIRFISSNKHKIAEVQNILGGAGVDVVADPTKVDEIQVLDTERLVRDKCLKAYRIVGRPVFVEHTGLEINALNGFPAGLTQVFWDSLQADRFVKLIGVNDDRRLTARTVIAYCDGMKIHTFTGEIKGSVPLAPRGNREFQWDCVFVPDGQELTFSELGEKKNEISMRKRALDKFLLHLRPAL